MIQGNGPGESRRKEVHSLETGAGGPDQRPCTTGGGLRAPPAFFVIPMK